MLVSGLTVLCAALTGHAQLTTAHDLRSSEATAISNDSAFINAIKDPNVVGSPSYVAGGITFSLVPNLALDSMSIGTGPSGAFEANVSYVYSSENDVDSFGVTDASLKGETNGGIGIFNPFTGNTAADLTFSVLVTDPTGMSALNLWAYDAQFPGTVFQNSSNFLTYQGVDLATNQLDTLFFYDDRNQHDPASVDHNDGLFLVQENLLPIGLNPVPEPSTYGLWGGALALSLAFMKRKALSSFCGASV